MVQIQPSPGSELQFAYVPEEMFSAGKFHLASKQRLTSIWTLLRRVKLSIYKQHYEHFIRLDVKIIFTVNVHWRHVFQQKMVLFCPLLHLHLMLLT